MVVSSTILLYDLAVPNNIAKLKAILMADYQTPSNGGAAPTNAVQAILQELRADGAARRYLAGRLKQPAVSNSGVGSWCLLAENWKAAVVAVDLFVKQSIHGSLHWI